MRSVAAYRLEELRDQEDEPEQAKKATVTDRLAAEKARFRNTVTEGL